MMTSSNGNMFRFTGFCAGNSTVAAGNSTVTGEFPSHRPVTRSFDVFLDLRPNKRLSKQPRRRWCETPSRSLWRHCKVVSNSDPVIRTAVGSFGVQRVTLVQFWIGETGQIGGLTLITTVMVHVWCNYEFRITNMKFASVIRGLTHFQGDFEWDLRQAIFKLILVINGWNCAQTNVMGAYWSVYIGSDNYLNQCSQRIMSPYDVTWSQRLEIGRPYHSWTSFREKAWAIQVSWSIHITITS